jgi:type II secretory pathway pseudopilin PulG
MTRSHADRGFTLVETLLTVLMVALISGVIAVSASVIFRARPAAEARVDDARTLLGLTTYLPEDMNSTPPGGLELPTTFADADSQTTGCSAGTDIGVSLARLTWTEDIGSVQTYRANYRYVPSGAGGKIQRFSCTGNGPESVLSMTSELPPLGSSWAPGDAPVRFVAAGADGLDIEVTTVAGDTLALELRSDNPAVTLPPVPAVPGPVIPPGNLPPTTNDVTASTDVGMSVVVAADADDPDVADGLTIALGTPTNGWTATVSTLSVTVTPPPTAIAGDSTAITYTATDPYGQVSNTSTITVTIALVPNTPPNAGNVSIPSVDEKVPYLINSFPVSDIDGDPLTITFGTTFPSGGILAASQVGAGTDVSITADGTVTNPAPLTYTVSDGRGGSATGTIDITNVVLCVIGAVTPSATSVARTTPGKYLPNNGVLLTVPFTGPCGNLVAWIDHDRNGTVTAFQATYATPGQTPATILIAGQTSVPIGLDNWDKATHNVFVENNVAASAPANATITVT